MSDQELEQSASEETTLNSRGYRFVKQLGEGSYAKVFLSLYNPVETSPASEHKTQLACKVIDTLKAPKDFVHKFLPRELDILIKLNHPHIVHVHSIFQRRSKYFIFMRYAENGDLLDFIIRTELVGENQARVWVRQMALAMQYLHSMEIAHRDLKCENVLLTANYNVKLADFGFARYMVDANGKRVLSETYCGSLSYAAPEVLRGLPYNPKIADLWSLGVILYIMFNKAMPFDDSNVRKLYEQQTGRKWKFRTKVDDTLSEEAKNLVVMLLEPEVNRRGGLGHILNSEWIAMDSRLLEMSPAEKTAMVNAQEERKKLYEGKAPSSRTKGLEEDQKVRPKSARERTTVDRSDDVKVIKYAKQNPTVAASRNLNA